MKKPMVYSQETRLTALSVAFLPGCAETRPISDAARSGAAYFDLELSNGDPNATAAGAGGVLLSEGLHLSRVGQSRSETAGRSPTCLSPIGLQQIDRHLKDLTVTVRVPFRMKTNTAILAMWSPRCGLWHSGGESNAQPATHNRPHNSL